MTPERLCRLPSWLVNRVAVAAYRLVMARLSEVGLRREHYAILAALQEFGPASQAEVSRRLLIDRSDVVATINDLERDQLAIRTPDQRDRRRNVIEITDRGSRTLRTLDGWLAEAQDELLEPLSAAERRQLEGLLRRLVQHHDDR